MLHVIENIDYTPLVSKELDSPLLRNYEHIKKTLFPGADFSYRPLTDIDIDRAHRLHSFAQANKCEFIGNLSGAFPLPESRFRSIGALKYPTMIPYAIILRLELGWLEVGQLRVDSDRESIYFTYAKVTLGQNLPHITIDSRSAGLPTFSLGQTLYSTESSEFNRLFKLYLDQSHARAGLKILSPDVMAILIDHFAHCDIEIRDNTIAFLTNARDLTDPYNLQDLLEMTAALTHELSYQVRSPVAQGALPQDIASIKPLTATFANQTPSFVPKPTEKPASFSSVAWVLFF